MNLLGLIFFSVGLALGVLTLLHASRAGGFNLGYLYGTVLVAGSLLMIGFAVLGLYRDIKQMLHDRNRPPFPHEKGFKPTPDQKIIFALQKEMTFHYERAKDEFERFECGDGPDHAAAAEESFRKAISACQRIGGAEGEVDAYSSEMLLSLADLLKMQTRHAEAKVILQQIVEFYQGQAQRTDGGEFMLDWGLAKRACEKLAAYEHSDGSTAAATALEDQGKHWIEKYKQNLPWDEMKKHSP